jgi:hypothetical protein
MEGINGVVDAALSGDLTEIDIKDHAASSGGPLTKTHSKPKESEEEKQYVQDMT